MTASSKELADKGSAPQPRGQGAASVLDFSQGRPEPVEETGSPAAEPLDLEQILASIRETAYRWDFKTDRIDWAANAQTVLGIADPAKIERGRAFARLVDPEQAGARYDGVTGGPHAAPGGELRFASATACFPRGGARQGLAVGRRFRRVPH